jgi:signal transduction histidine kinase
LRKQLPALDDQVTATLTRLKSEISRLNSLLQDFRSLSRKETYHFQTVSLAELVAEAIEIEIPEYAERGVKIETRFAPDLPKVRVDIDKMKQVILNLAKNAVERADGWLPQRSLSTDKAAVTLNYRHRWDTIRG